MRIDRRDFESKLTDFIFSLRRTIDEPNRKELQTVILSKMERASWNVDKALISVVPEIELKELRNNCRGLLIAYKHSAALSYYGRRDSSQPYVSYAGDDCVLLQFDDSNGPSTAILSPTGDIKTDKGELYINSKSLSCKWCFTARGVADKRNKYGLVYGDGSILLPCVFDDIENSLLIEAQYKEVAFLVTFYDNQCEEKDSYEREYMVKEGLFLNISGGMKQSEDQVKELFSILDDFYFRERLD